MTGLLNAEPIESWNVATIRGGVSRVVLVLSGGGAKALAHAGAFRALEQAELVPSHIIATSMGAVVGAALGAGMPFDQVRRRAMGIRRKDVAPFDPLALLMGLFARSLFPASALRRAIARIVPKTRFEYLRIPLTRRSKPTAGAWETAVSGRCYPSRLRVRSSPVPICSSLCTWDRDSMSGR